jgi:hypothetical protein
MNLAVDSTPFNFIFIQRSGYFLHDKPIASVILTGRGLLPLLDMAGHNPASRRAKNTPTSHIY